MVSVFRRGCETRTIMEDDIRRNISHYSKTVLLPNVGDDTMNKNIKLKDEILLQSGINGHN